MCIIGLVGRKVSLLDSVSPSSISERLYIACLICMAPFEGNLVLSRKCFVDKGLEIDGEGVILKPLN